MTPLLSSSSLSSKSPSSYNVFVVTSTISLLSMVFRLLEFVISAPAFLWNTTTKKKRVAPGRVKNTKTVAIVGGNFAGLAALRELQSCWKKKSRYCYDNDSDETETTALRIVLIDKRGYSEYTP